MRPMFNPKLADIFDFLETEKIPAHELKRGDVAFIHSRWNLALKVQKKKDPYRVYNQDEIIDINGMDGTGTLPINHSVKIIKRGVFDIIGLEKFMAEYEAWRHEMEESCRKANEEDRIREKMVLRKRLEELGGNDDDE